jgi:hypothetical protein
MTNSSEPDSAPSEDQLRDACAELLTSWATLFTGVESVDLGVEGQAPDAVRFAVVLSLAAHAHHVTTVAADLMHAEDYLSAIPLLRVGYESALTAAWAAHSEEAARALQNEYVSTAHKLYRSASRTGWFDEQLSEPQDQAAEVAASAKHQASQFFALCEALEPGGAWLYTQYRLLSAYCHASGSVLKAFSTEDSLSLHPRMPPDNRAWWHAAAINLLHAGQAADRLDPAATRRRQLLEASDVIGWPEPLRLTQAAAADVARARAARAALVDDAASTDADPREGGPTAHPSTS